jgi:hypothetical protein
MVQGHLTTTFREGVNTYYPPLHPLATALLTPLVGTIERAGVVVQHSVVRQSSFRWWLTRRVFGPIAAWIAVLLSVTNPPHSLVDTPRRNPCLSCSVSAIAILFCATEGGSIGWLMVGGLCADWRT